MKEKLPDDIVREEIVQAAAQVFENYGYIKSSMQDISDACGKSRSSLYYYFKNIDDVFDAFADKRLNEIFDGCRTQVHPEASLQENLVNFQLYKLNHIKTLIRRYHLAFKDLRQDLNRLFIKIRLLLNEEIAFLAQVIRWAIQKKEIKALSDEDTIFLAETIVTGLRGFEQEIFLFNRFPDFEDKLSWMVSIFYKGLK